MIFLIVSAHLRQCGERNDVTGKNACTYHLQSYVTAHLPRPTGVYICPAAPPCIITVRNSSTTSTSTLVDVFFATMRGVSGQTLTRLFRTAVWKTTKYRQLSAACTASGEMSIHRRFTGLAAFGILENTISKRYSVYG